MSNPIRAVLFAGFVPALLIAIASIGCGSSGRDGKAGGMAPSIRDFRIGTVRDVGTIDTNPAIRMRDSGYSASYQGRSVWIFGDTILSFANAEERALLRNSWSSTADSDARDGLAGFQERVDEAGAPTPFFPLTEEEREFNRLHRGDDCLERPCNVGWAIWPGTIVVDRGAQRAYVFYHKVYVQQGLLNFRHVGHSIAIWNDFHSAAERLVFNHYQDYPTLLFSGAKEGFGSAAVVAMDQVYVYGCELKQKSLRKPCLLARVALEDILDRDAWRYYRGGGNWSSQLSDAVPVFDGNNMMSVFYNPYVERYLAVYSQPMDRRVMLRSAPAPEGPWSNPSEVFVAKAPDNTLGWIYDALAHPEFSQYGGRLIYVTYSRQTGPMTSEMRLVSVELERTF